MATFGMYIRGNDGDQIERQRRACSDYIKTFNDPEAMVKVYTDHGSGHVWDRDGLLALRQDIKRGDVDIVVTEDLTRLTRRQDWLSIFIAELSEYKVQLHTPNDGQYTDQMVESLRKFATTMRDELGHRFPEKDLDS